MQKPLLDISGIQELRDIEWGPNELRLGAGVRWADLQRRRLPSGLDALVQASREVGGWQIQHRASLGGNLCNASPAADGVVPLLALDAKIELTSAQSRRILPLSEFITGPRTTQRAPNELLTSILVPQPERLQSCFFKLGSRRYLVISLVMLALVVRLDAARRIAHCAIAVGACSPVAQRLGELERALIGQPIASALAWLDRALHEAHWFAPLQPIDDVRATGQYRLDAVKIGLRRSFERVLAQ